MSLSNLFQAILLVSFQKKSPNWVHSLKTLLSATRRDHLFNCISRESNWKLVTRSHLSNATHRGSRAGHATSAHGLAQLHSHARSYGVVSFASVVFEACVFGISFFSSFLLALYQLKLFTRNWFALHGVSMAFAVAFFSTTRTGRTGMK